MTNATKAMLIAVANSLLGVLAAFGVGFTEAQNGAILAALNAVLALVVGLTYKNSPTRIPDDA